MSGFLLVALQGHWLLLTPGSWCRLYHQKSAAAMQQVQHHHVGSPYSDCKTTVVLFLQLGTADGAPVEAVTPQELAGFQHATL